MVSWDLKDSDGTICVPNVFASREEMIVAVQAANTKQPESAPFCAISEDGERVETDDTLDEAVVDEPIRRVEGA